MTITLPPCHRFVRHYEESATGSLPGRYLRCRDLVLAVESRDEADDLVGDPLPAQPDPLQQGGALGVVEELWRDAEVAQRRPDVRVPQGLRDRRADAAHAAVVLDGDDQPVPGRE